MKNPHAAEDITATAFAKLAERAEAGHAPDARLLTKIVNDLLIDFYRRKRPEVPVGDATRIDAVLYPDDPEIRSLERRTKVEYNAPLTPEVMEFRVGFDQALRALPEDERDAFILTDVRGLTTREAADVLAVDHSTVVRRAQAARNTLREELF